MCKPRDSRKEPGNEEHMADRHAVASGEEESRTLQVPRHLQQWICLWNILRERRSAIPCSCTNQFMLSMTYKFVCWMYSMRWMDERVGTSKKCWICIEKKMPEISEEVNWMWRGTKWWGCVRHVEERAVKHAVRWDDFQEGAQICNTSQSCHLRHTHACPCEECCQVRNTNKIGKMCVRRGVLSSLPVAYKGIAIACVSRTPSHIACADANTLSAHHPWCYTLTRDSRLKNCVPKNIFSFHLLFRTMSHDLHSTPSTLFPFSLSSTSPSSTGSGSRLITSRIHCADSRDLRGDGFTDPEPRTACKRNSLTKSTNA